MLSASNLLLVSQQRGSFPARRHHSRVPAPWRQSWVRLVPEYFWLLRAPLVGPRSSPGPRPPLSPRRRSNPHPGLPRATLPRRPGSDPLQRTPGARRRDTLYLAPLPRRTSVALGPASSGVGNAGRVSRPRVWRRDRRRGRASGRSVSPLPSLARVTRTWGGPGRSLSPCRYRRSRSGSRRLCSRRLRPDIGRRELSLGVGRLS